MIEVSTIGSDENFQDVPDDLPEDLNATFGVPIPTRTPALLDSRFETLASSDIRPSAKSLTIPSDQYHREKLIGKGGMGEVWVAWHPALARRVALKRLHSDDFTPEQFCHEAIIAAQLDHPNIAPVYQLAEGVDGKPEMAMKLIEGRNWNGVLSKDFAKFGAEEFLAKHLPIFLQVAQAVAYAHSRGIVHRDLKPSQVVIGEYGEVYLIDWGLALVLEERPELSQDWLPTRFPTRATALGPAGTVSYMAPEQTRRDCLEIDARTDVYLLGGILYSLLTGKPPHPAPISAAAFVQARNGIVTPIDKAAPGREIPADLARVVATCLKPEKRDRPSHVREIIDAIKDYLSGAGNRLESTRLTDEVDVRLRGEAVGYRLLAECDRQLAQALEHWPGNEKARRLMGDNLARVCELAIANADLRLARITADRLPSEAARAPLLERIAALERGARMRDFQRCWFTRISIILAVAFFLAFLFFYRQNSTNLEERNRLQEQVWQLERRDPASP